MKSSAKTSEPVASRRRLLALLPPLGAGLLAPRFAAAEPCEPRLLVSVADSLLQYRSILESAGSEATDNAGRRMAHKYQQSRDLWGELKVKLEELLQHLKAANSRASVDGLPFPEETGAIEKNIAWIKGGLGSPAEVRKARALSLQMAMASMMQQIARNCTLDPGNKIQSLITEILDDLNGQGQTDQGADDAEQQWNQQVGAINGTTSDCESKLVEAAQLLTLALQSAADESASIARAKAILSDISATLTNQIGAVERASALAAKGTGEAPAKFHWEKTKVLVAILDAAENTIGRAEAASYFPNGIQMGGIVPAIRIDRSSLLGRVIDVVRKPNYFKPSPGSDYLALGCVVALLPIWWNYPNVDEQAKRENLIRSILDLGVVPSVNSGDDATYSEVVHDLAAVCNPAAQGAGSNASIG